MAYYHDRRQKMKQIMTLIKNVIVTIALPGIMFLIMLWISRLNGITYFGKWPMWRSLIVSCAGMITTAYAIGIQFKSGRFDFSGGGIMLLAAIYAGRISVAHNNSIFLYVGVSLVVCILLSILVAVVYIFGRLPIIIATIGMALVFESITTLIYGGAGINIVANMELKQLATFPMVLIPLGLSIAVYGFYSIFTVVGKQAVLLSFNQQSSVNIGINEKKNIFITYLYSGILYGLATTIYAVSGIHDGAFTSLVTVGSLFSNILPVFIGLMFVKYCGDTIGIIVGSVTLTLMSYGLSAIFSAEMGTAISTIITGIFIFGINVFSAQGSQMLQGMKRLIFRRKVSN